jgi:hypothetical protein
MGMKALLHGSAGPYELRGAIWEIGSSTFRAYIHLVPRAPDAGLSRSVVSAEGTTVQDVLSETETHVRSAVGQPVESLELIPGAEPTPEPDTAPPRERPVPRRYPPPTD